MPEQKTRKARKHGGLSHKGTPFCNEPQAPQMSKDITDSNSQATTGKPPALEVPQLKGPKPCRKIQGLTINQWNASLPLRAPPASWFFEEHHMLHGSQWHPAWLGKLRVQDDAPVFKVAVPMTVGALRSVWPLPSVRLCGPLLAVIPTMWLNGRHDAG